MYIYDAKYYNIILNKEHVKKQPSVGDITKQYLYELAYKEFAEENNLEIVKNAFLMPTDKDEDIILGCARMDMFSKLKEINVKEIEVILKSAHKMYDIYLNN